ncbi:hypothetical protein BDZ97DRAFT_1926531 [Flammula alnicola]|nr:hypothetical protein BDZ97DRAFT_1926531 [Flammula alnicola]
MAPAPAPEPNSPWKKPKTAIVGNEPTAVNSTNLDTSVAEPLVRGREPGSNAESSTSGSTEHPNSVNLVTKYLAAHADSANNTVLSTMQSQELIEPTTTNAHHSSSSVSTASPPFLASLSSPALRRPIPCPIGHGIKRSQTLTHKEEDEMFMSNRARY